MIFDKVTFNDYKGYKGKNEIMLSVDCKSKRNIILIRAQNGVGKTSFLNGIKLVLYGERAGLTKGESYERFIRQTINRSSYREGNRKFNIELELHDENRTSNKDNITIKREWTLNIDGKLKDESLYISNNGKLLFNVDDEQNKNDFIESIIPIGVAQFFLFDGEKLEELADDYMQGEAITEGIMDILNISNFKTLVSDLETYEKFEKRQQADVLESDIMQAEVELKITDEDIEKCTGDISIIEKNIENFNAKKNELEKWLRNHGASSVPGKRKKIQEQLENQLTNQDESINYILNYSKNILANLIALPLIVDVDEQIKLEEENRISQEKYIQKDEIFNTLIKRLDDEKIQPPLTLYQKDKVKQALYEEWINKFNRPISSLEEVIHDISKHESQELQEEICDSVEDIWNEQSNIQNQINLYENSCYEIDKLTLEMKKIPTDAKIDTNETKLKETEEEIQNLKFSLYKKEDMLKELNYKREKQYNTYNDLINKVQVSKISEQRIEVSKKIRETLSDFLDELVDKKAEEVKKYLSHNFKILARKIGLIDEYEINSKTFDVQLKNKYGEIVYKNSLSEGEKLIYSVSLVWALALASKRVLPIVIDTPLGKLDRVHRRAMLEKYFPNSSKQVIILSTDSEIYGQWKSMIEPYISSEYTIVDNNLGSYIIPEYYDDIGGYYNESNTN